MREDVRRPLNGRRILLTGAASGIGLASARRCLELGASVVVTDVDRDRLEEHAAHLGVPSLVADLADPSLLAAMVDAAAATLEGLDGVVNAAGISCGARLEALSMDVWEKVIGINLTAPYAVAQAALPHLRKCSDASIVNVASGAGLLPTSPGTSGYAASKAGLIGFSRALALELAPAVRVNVVCPGLTRTPMTEHLLGPESSMADSYALGRPAEPEEIARAITFLLGDEASYITGSVLAADGGRTFH